jgi:chemosensory pili system protein ChpA (sensor histidine kinase/response regulator)
MTDPKPLALIVEDDESIGMVAVEALRLANYNPELVRDGAVAWQRLVETDPAILLLDLHLPYVSGRELLRRIRANDRLKHLRVIVATADPITANILEREADLVLIKPYSIVQLKELASRLNPLVG